VISSTWRIAAASAVAAVVVTDAAPYARDTSTLHPADAFQDHALVERGLLLVRLDPKRGAPPGACDALSARDLIVTIGGVAANVTSVERVSRPERHWLLIDISESAEGRRSEAKRSAQQYVREVMAPRVDAATLVTIDDDVVLAAGPSGDPATLVAKIGEIPAGGTSALRDGLETVLRQVEGDRHEQLILYWTDGQDTESIDTLDELLVTLSRTPHATIFPIVLRPTRGSDALRPPAGTFLFEVARRSGGQVLGSSDPRWLDRVRAWIARRFAVSVAYSEGTHKGRVAVAPRDKNCVATLLRDPFARPDPVAGTAPPAPSAWVRLHAKQQDRDDAACSGDSVSPSWEWPWRNEHDTLGGCLLDVIRTPTRFAARDVRVLAPGIAALPGSLGEAIESLLSPEAGPSPLLVSGNALLAQRARIAASLFAERSDYRNFAIARLTGLAEDEIRAIEREIARDFPDLPTTSIAAIARSSRAGRRALDAARTPTDADLARVLAAWLSDVPARSLFRQWESRLIDARIASGRDPSAGAKWTALRAHLARTEGARVVAPLILIRDPARDLIGFSRVVLPRRRGMNVSAEDLIPERPLALELVDRVAAAHGVGERLAAGGYRAVRIDEASRVPAWRTGFGDPFRQAHVTVALVSWVEAARAVLDADVRAGKDGALTLVRFTASVNGDSELAALLQESGTYK
jgi:hypothetical protein